MPNNIRDKLQAQINRIAYTHFDIRPWVEFTLRDREITPEGRSRVGDYATMYDFWRGTYADKFSTWAL
jgi:hypothetical protein